MAPTFSQLPWYADHPTDPEIRQEAHFLKVVVPLVEARYPARSGPGGRLLLGFSKSGWGAYSLLLRHPDLFGKAAAWDAPLMMGWPPRYGSGDIFGTPENFERYQITRLLERRAAELRGPDRLILLDHGNFRDHHERAHALMTDLEIPHVYQDGRKREHAWGSGWVPEAVQLLLGGERPSRLAAPPMSDFRDLSRRTYADLGRPLTPQDGNADSRIEAGEKRLGSRSRGLPAQRYWTPNRLPAETTRELRGIAVAEVEKLELGKGAAFVRSRLKRLPQGDETWEADFRALPKPIEQSQTHYLGMVVTGKDGWLLAETTVHGRPSVNDLATILAHAMRRPVDENARRPGLIHLRGHHQWRELFPHLEEIGVGVKVFAGQDLPGIEQAYNEHLRPVREARRVEMVQPTPEQTRIDTHFPSIARWVKEYGWIEIGVQELFGFVARALHEGGTQVEDERPDTLAEAMAALEVGLARWFEKEGVEPD